MFLWATVHLQLQGTVIIIRSTGQGKDQGQGQSQGFITDWLFEVNNAIFLQI
jgi:hypothetical protein